ncbi:hypothetical protein ACFFRR_006568 [Megaselia abdita]
MSTSLLTHYAQASSLHQQQGLQASEPNQREINAQTHTRIVGDTRNSPDITIVHSETITTMSSDHLPIAIEIERQWEKSTALPKPTGLGSKTTSNPACILRS